MGSHKKKRSQKRHRSSSSSSRSSADLDKKLDTHRKEKERQRDAEKRRMKEMETPEEKRARRLEKKLRKEEKRKKQDDEGYLPPSVPYTNLNNPFNDPKLTETFVWGKKLEHEGKARVSKRQLESETRDRVKRNLYEMEELKRHRDARLAAQEDYEMIKRDQEKAIYGDWDKKEIDFQLMQAKMRSRLRIEQNRAKPIDLLIRYIEYRKPREESDEEKPSDEFELEHPWRYVQKLSAEDYDDLFEDIKVCKRLDGDKNQEFWEDIKTIATDESRKLTATRRESTFQTVQSDIENIYRGKSLDELNKLRRDIEKRVEQRNVGSAYWEELLQRLTVHMAKLRLRDLHRQMLDLKLKRIREEQLKEMGGDIGEKLKPAVRALEDQIKAVDRSRSPSPSTSGAEKWKRPRVNLAALEDPELDEREKEQKWTALLPEELEEATLQLYEIGNYSPQYGATDDVMPGIEVLDEHEDAKNLDNIRDNSRKKPEGLSEAEATMLAVAKKGMEGDECTFSVEVPLETQKNLWSDKFRPRKPRYLNRVQTGFEWNKYNQTHYDLDNPPPKVVQGYKFNIFYPDLLDMTRTPTFQIYPDPHDTDFAMIKFHAGPPYEDIAFKIVNREWEILYKNGYKCQFQGGVFQLWFAFKKYRYRR